MEADGFQYPLWPPARDCCARLLQAAGVLCEPHDRGRRPLETPNFGEAWSSSLSLETSRTTYSRGLDAWANEGVIPVAVKAE